MNYIKQIQAFHDRMLTKPLSSGQIALWYALMYINNKAAWTEWFTVANQTLESQSGLSRSGIQKARNQLRQLGYISFKANGTRATSYRIQDLTLSKIFDTSDSTQESNQDSTQEFDTLNSNQVSTQDSNQVSTQDSNQVSTQDRDTLNKRNETKQNETENMHAARARIALLYQKKIKPMDNPQNIDRVQSFLEDGLPAEVIELAIEISNRDGGFSAGYVVKKLNDWIARGVKTLDDAKLADNVWKDSHKKKVYKEPVRKEVLPEWAKDGYDWRLEEEKNMRQQEIKRRELNDKIHRNNGLQQTSDDVDVPF